MTQIKHITISTPCKMMLAGEWAVVEPDGCCIVMTIDRFVTTTITPAPTISIISDLFANTPIAAYWQNKTLTLAAQTNAELTRRMNFAVSAITTILCYLQECGTAIQPFSLAINSLDASTMVSRNGTRIKLGVGSSAAVVVGITKALFAHHNIDYTSASALQTIFKLSCIAHYNAQESLGSGFDIAASTFATTIAYHRFDPDVFPPAHPACPAIATWRRRKCFALQNVSRDHTLPIVPFVHQTWQDLLITPLNLPPQLIPCIGFTGESASTPQLLRTMNLFKKAQPQLYASICSQITETVKNLIQAINTHNVAAIINLINKNHHLLVKLDTASGCKLYTKKLTTLVDCVQEHEGAAAKLSGAGGGDCGIALCCDKKIQKRITKTWLTAGITPL